MDAETIFQAIKEFEDAHDRAAARADESYSITRKRQLALHIWFAQSREARETSSSVIVS